MSGESRHELTTRERVLAALERAQGPDVAAQVQGQWEREGALKARNAEKRAKARQIDSSRRTAGRVAEPRPTKPRRIQRAKTHDRKGLPLAESIKRKQARNAERQRRYQMANQKAIDTYEQSLKAAGQLDAKPMGIPGKAWSCVQACKADTTGRMHRRYLAELPPMIARRMLKTALLTGTENERPTLAHPAARRTIVALLGLWHCSKVSRRYGYARVTTGIPLGMVDAWVCPPHVTRKRDKNNRRIYSRTYLTGETRGVPAPLKAAAELFGLFHKHKPPGTEVHASERGPSGHAFNQYHWPRYSTRGAPCEDDEREAAIRTESAPGIRAELEEALKRPPPVIQDAA